MPDRDGYPTPEELDKITMWPHDGDMKDLVEFLQSIWEFDPPTVENGTDDLFEGKKVKKIGIHSWGWSGNEDIIECLKNSRSMFWFFFWQRSERGGHYYFSVPLWAWERDKI